MSSKLTYMEVSKPEPIKHTHTKAKQTKIKGKKVCKTAKQARCLPCKPDNLV